MNTFWTITASIIGISLLGLAWEYTQAANGDAWEDEHAASLWVGSR